MEHSEISPSMLHRIMGEDACTASVQASRGIEEGPANPAAMQGDAYHRAAESCLRTGFEPDEDDAPMLQPYLDYISEVCASLRDPTLLVEQRVSLERWVPGMFGTADAIVFGLGRQSGAYELHVVDLKTGRHPVRAEANPQLMAYALGAMCEAGRGTLVARRKFRPEWVLLHICQPSLAESSECAIEPTELYAFGDELARAAAEALGPSPVFRPSESNCRWCRAAPTCSALHRQMVATIGGDFDDLPDPDAMTDEALATVVLRRAEVERWMKRLCEYAVQRVQAGTPIAGTKLVEGAARRRWNDDALEQLRSIYGSEVVREQLISITEAEKVIGKKMTSRYTSTVQFAPKLVGLDDKRPAIEPAAEDFAAITTEKD